jgi:hypothetical protein
MFRLNVTTTTTIIVPPISRTFVTFNWVYHLEIYMSNLLSETEALLSGQVTLKGTFPNLAVSLLRIFGIVNLKSIWKLKRLKESVIQILVVTVESWI